MVSVEANECASESMCCLCFSFRSFSSFFCLFVCLFCPIPVCSLSYYFTPLLFRCLCFLMRERKGVNLNGRDWEELGEVNYNQNILYKKICFQKKQN